MAIAQHAFKATFRIQKAVKDEEEKFWVEGYASHGDTDSYGDQISPAGLEDLASKMAGVVLLLNHNPDRPIGKVTEAKHLPDDKAVWVKAWVSDDEVVAMVEDGRLEGMSIHAIPSEWRIVNTADQYYIIIDAWERVVEHSLTPVPVQEKAKILNHYVKSFRLEGEKMDEEKIKEIVKTLLAEHSTTMLETLKTGIGEQIVSAIKSLVSEPIAAPDVDPENKPPDAIKAVSVDDVKQFLDAQATALESIASDDEAITSAIATVASALRAKMDEMVETDEEKGLDPPADPPAVDPPPAPETDATQEALKALFGKIEELSKAVQDQRREKAATLDLTPVPDVPKSALDGLIFQIRE